MEAINLCELLVPGMEVFSIIHNTKKRIEKIEPETEFPIIIGRKEKKYKQLRFNQFGSLLPNGTECLIFPDKDITTWEGFITPVIFDKGEVVRAITESGKQLISIYSHFDKETQKHFCFHTIEDDYHPANVIPRLQAKYNITKNTAREDIKLAQELFKSKHSFDYDFWQQWQIKDLVDTIRTCKLKGKEKERIAAQKVLKDVIGAKPESAEDPKRMEKNVFYIQLNNNQTTVNIPMEKLKGLSSDEVRTVVATLTAPEVEDAQIVDI